MLFPENLPAVADAVMLEALLQGPSQYFFFSYIEEEDQRARTSAATQHKQAEHLNDSF